MPLTVKEAIKLLKKYPENTEIFFRMYDDLNEVGIEGLAKGIDSTKKHPYVSFYDYDELEVKKRHKGMTEREKVIDTLIGIPENIKQKMLKKYDELKKH